jgi:chromate transporter
MMREQLVQRRGWLSDERFLDLLGAANLIPGPNSTELAIHIGFERRRYAGLVVAGVSFIVPAMLITGALGYVYVHFQQRPTLGFLFYGIKPVIVAVVAQAIYGLLQSAARSARLRILGAAALALTAFGLNELVVLFGTGIASALLGRSAPQKATRSSVAMLDALLPASAIAGSAAAHAVTLPLLFGVFFKIGSVLFGSGYVLLSFLRADLVQRLGWLSEAQLLDAIAVGQVTPGPVFTTATFIGYLLRGPSGAALATLGIFTPAFVYVALSGPLVPRLRASARAGAFLDGVNVASLALMVVVTAQLAEGAVVDLPSVGLLLLSGYLLIWRRVNATWLLLGGALIGVLRQLV